MVDRQVVLGRISVIEECLDRIRDVRSRGEELRSRDAEEIVILNLQRAIQAGIDIATHVVATEQLGLPESLADSFTRLAREGILSEELAERLRRMVGFRNIVVHAYETIDPEIVESIVETRLGDLRELSRSMILHFNLKE